MRILIGLAARLDLFAERTGASLFSTSRSFETVAILSATGRLASDFLAASLRRCNSVVSGYFFTTRLVKDHLFMTRIWTETLSISLQVRAARLRSAVLPVQPHPVTKTFEHGRSLWADPAST